MLAVDNDTSLPSTTPHRHHHHRATESSPSNRSNNTASPSKARQVWIKVFPINHHKPANQKQNAIECAAKIKCVCGGMMFVVAELEYTLPLDDIARTKMATTMMTTSDASPKFIKVSTGDNLQAAALASSQGARPCDRVPAVANITVRQDAGRQAAARRTRCVVGHMCRKHTRRPRMISIS